MTSLTVLQVVCGYLRRDITWLWLALWSSLMCGMGGYLGIITLVVSMPESAALLVEVATVGAVSTYGCSGGCRACRTVLGLGYLG